ncbi:hypothetical protein IAR55_006275 [Kwoniella newhampshirensis]|uniref:Metaxin glutathione S-transferase domain-containing protein n=1 Tax=Kwoniella newhampshirensis TaxID=1651941 RepID=A0AAW0YV22_9TREE
MTPAIAQQTSPSTSGSSLWTAPTWVKSFYSRFPLVILEQEDELDWKVRVRDQSPQSCVLWIHPSSPNSSHPHHRPWLSASPASLRTQLLFLLRDAAASVPVSFREWSNENSAPGGTLPALHLPGQDRLIPTDEVRGWLEATYPLKGKGKELQGLPSQEAYDRALALSQLILGHLLPAYLASLPTRPQGFHLLFPVPPPLFAGLTTPLPASLTGDTRDIDIEEVVRKGVDALEAVEVILSEQGHWALGARHPTSLDALVASHLYVVYSLSNSSVLRTTIDSKAVLGEYVDRVLSYAENELNEA